MNQIYESQQNRPTQKRAINKVIIAVILILVALAVTNPTKEDFVEYSIRNMNDSVGITEGIADLIGRPLLNSVTERDNFFLFSIYYYGDGQEGGKYLGLFKRLFIEL